MPLQDIIIFTI